MVTAILKFEIRNTFAEWEQAFYSHQPIARAAMYIHARTTY